MELPLTAVAEDDRAVAELAAGEKVWLEAERARADLAGGGRGRVALHGVYNRPKCEADAVAAGGHERLIFWWGVQRHSGCGAICKEQAVLSVYHRTHNRHSSLDGNKTTVRAG
jgi:hypothetical protein